MLMEQTILLVEDYDPDAELTILAFKKARITNPVVRVCDGVEALDYLLGRGNYAGRDPNDAPAVVLLDLNLPRLGGLDVLRGIRADERIKHLPVAILTSSNEEKDRLAAHAQYANSYIRKPVDYDQFVAAARELGLCWSVHNQVAPRTVG
jgi:two-component system response regulator